MTGQGSSSRSRTDSSSSRSPHSNGKTIIEDQQQSKIVSAPLPAELHPASSQLARREVDADKDLEKVPQADGWMLKSEASCDAIWVDFPPPEMGKTR
ncbi:hypothetical protein NDA14_003932 [Ustilago hordei]|nr:hypothetical protein NDA14_003932 [Ustilago hordei]